MGDNITGISTTPTNGTTVGTSCDNSQEAVFTVTASSSNLVITDSKVKKKRRNKSDLGEDFIAPDGGWGWFVTISSGFNIVSKIIPVGLVLHRVRFIRNLVTFAVSQELGIIFRDHMSKLGISSSQLTSIINMQIAVTALTGLINGPLFRRFSFRQVALFGSFLTFLGLLACVFANSFLLYCLSYSCGYGFGRGLIVSASSLVVNTYFKERRRTAMSLKFGVAGVGPICLPYLATFLLDDIGAQGTILFFAGFSLNAVPCSLTYHPVKWHVKTQQADKKTITEDGHITTQPVLTHANEVTDKNPPRNSEAIRKLDTPEANDHTFTPPIEVEKDCEERNQTNELPTKLQVFREPNKEKALENTLTEAKKERQKKRPWYMKVVAFFDLDLLRDFTYVNLAIGLTIINFVELNFAILTPFILSDFGFEKNQIALAMSLLAAFDLIIRFLIPLITAKINLSNKTFFILGILGMCIGRLCLSFTRNFHILIAIFIWLGLNKAFRTVFWSLIIPGYVSLKKLPAAYGLEHLTSGLFSLAFGPVIGLIRDKTNYAFVLNFLNVLGLLAIAAWISEALVRKYRNKFNSARET